MPKNHQKFQKPRKNKQKCRKTVKNVKKPGENRQKYRKIIKNLKNHQQY